MAVGPISSLDARRFYRDDGPIEQGHEPTHRPRKPDAASFHFIALGKENWPISWGRSSNKTVFAALPASSLTANRYSPFGV